MKFNILIVEDEFIAFEYLKGILIEFGYKNIYGATNFSDALEFIKKINIDLIFMDINIDGPIDGIMCSKIVNEQYFIPIIYTTAYADSNTINEAKNNNIFGYIIKPFSVKNVEATLQIALNFIGNIKNSTKPKKNNNSFIKLDESYEYQLKSKTLFCDKISVNLTKKEILVLDLLCKNIKQNVSYELLQEFVWGSDISLSTIRDTISRLKKKAPSLKIENIANYGYILNPSS